MTEQEKAAAGLLYDATDAGMAARRRACKEKCEAFNRLAVTEEARAHEILRGLLGRLGKNCHVEPHFWCDYGYNIQAGDNLYINHNCVILDCCAVTFGDNVLIAPNCGFYTAGHPEDALRRNGGLEYAKPITVGDNVWIGGGVTVLPGVTIGAGAVIGGGSVVCRDIPAGMVAVGNPCRPIRPVREEG